MSFFCLIVNCADKIVPLTLSVDYFDLKPKKTIVAHESIFLLICPAKN